ncbi:MAG: hypothetical protein WCD60_30350 [Pseudolabrys sp.]
MSAFGGKADFTPGRRPSAQPPPPIPQLSPREGALSRVGQRPALGHCPPPASLVLHILERGFQVGHVLLGPLCAWAQFRISRL